MPCYGNIPEGDEIVEHWSDDERVAIFNLLDDLGQPFSCTMWGDAGIAGSPIIIDDGAGNNGNDLGLYGWFDDVTAYPVNVFLDHEMNVVNITEAEMNQTAVNNVIQGMVDLIPPCEDPIAPNFNEPGQCDYTDIFTSYETNIQPIFDNNCTQCHGNSGGLSLANYNNLMSSSVISPNDGENSTIYERMTSSTSPMPPPPTGLIDAYLAERIKAWIDQGACENNDGSVDECGICDNDSSNDCIQDCNGDWGGNLVDDECGVCGGDNSTCTDCNEVVNGSAITDGCGDCVGGTTGLEVCITDCAGVDGGNAIRNECNTCICNGSIALDGFECFATEVCIAGCDGFWYNDGTAPILDTCQVCEGDGSSCLSIQNQIPHTFSINNIYPNPFNPLVNIEYSLATSNLVNISIYDLNGQMVDPLFSGHQTVGNYQITWDASEMSSGIYIIMIQSGNVILSDQLILLK